LKSSTQLAEGSTDTQDINFNPEDYDPMDEMEEQDHFMVEPEQNNTSERPRRVFDEPHALAEAYLEKHARAGDETTLRYWRGTFYKWRWDHYDELMDYELQGPVSKFIREVFDGLAKKYPNDKDINKARVTTSVVSNVAHAMMSRISVKATLEPPVYLDGRTTPGGLLPLANGILHVGNALEGIVKPIKPHTPRLFNLSCASYAYDPDAKCPLWDQFVDRVMEQDPERICRRSVAGHWSQILLFKNSSSLLAKGRMEREFFVKYLRGWSEPTTSLTPRSRCLASGSSCRTRWESC
jgi:hypothetical protein